MKSGLAILLCVVSFWGCQSSNSENPMEKTLSKKDALEDFYAFCSILKNAHPSLHTYISKADFRLLEDSIKKSITENITIGNLFSKYNYIVNEIGCAHTYVTIANKDYDTLLNRKFFFPLPVKLIEGRLLVNARNMLLPQGTEIIAINSKSATKVIDEIMKYESVEGVHRTTQQKLAVESFALNYFYTYGKSSNFTLQVIDTLGQEKSINNVAAITLEDWYQNKTNLYYFDRTYCDYDLYVTDEKKYAYMRMKTFSFDTDEEQIAFENFCKNSFELLQLKKNIPALIIDLRDNTGGDLYNSSLLFSYLAKEKFSEYQSASSKIRQVDYALYLHPDFSENDKDDINTKLSEEFVYNSLKQTYQRSDSFIAKWVPQESVYKGNVFLITNAKVGSAASYFSVLVKNSGVGKVIGEETSGGNYSGNAFKKLHYSLPYSKLQLMFPYGHIVYSYKENINKGRGLQPNFDVPDSYESFKNNADNQFDFIRDSLLLK